MSGRSQVLSKITRNSDGIETVVLGPQEDYGQKTTQVRDKESPLNASDLEAVTRARVMDICKVKPDL